MTNNNKEMLHDIYKEISEQLGFENAVRIYEMFKGQQISFPVRLYDTKKLRSVIRDEFNGANFRELALKYGYSEKSIRRIIKEAAQDD